MRLGTLWSLAKELNVSAQSGKPLVVGGARNLVPMLRREIGVAGNEDPRGAAVYVHVWAGDGEDEAQLKRARKARTPIVAIAPDAVDSIPYVLATDIVRLPAGAGFPLEELAEAIAGRLGEEAAPLAGRLPFLRRAVARQLIAGFARRNGIVAAAVFIPGVDLPVLLRNELRLVARLEQVYGREPGDRTAELAATAAVGFGLRAAARELLDLIPVAGWAVKGAVAYAGTRALGEATLRRLEKVGPGGH